MGKTISTHNGSAAQRDHNIRNPRTTDVQDHIDKALSGQNEIIIDEKPRDAYKRIFGAALEDYNIKQKRDDRKIADYYTHVCKDKKKNPVYEMIVQVGNRHDTGINAPTERTIIKEFISGWKDRNPYLELIGAYIHADEKEGTLHAHLDYIPVAHGYTNGMSVQSGLVKALGEQGFEKRGKETAQILWQHRENATLEEICKAHGIEVNHLGSNRSHMDTPEFKEYAELKEMYAWDLDCLQGERVLYQDEIEDLQVKCHDLRDIAQAGIEARQKLQGTLALLDHAKDQKNALEREIERLREDKAVTTSEVSNLKEQFSDARQELDIVTVAITNKNDDGVRQLGWSSWKKQISAAKEAVNQGNRFALLEKFVDLPHVKPAWEAFCQASKSKRKRMDEQIK